METLNAGSERDGSRRSRRTKAAAAVAAFGLVAATLTIAQGGGIQAAQAAENPSAAAVSPAAAAAAAAPQARVAKAPASAKICKKAKKTKSKKALKACAKARKAAKKQAKIASVSAARATGARSPLARIEAESYDSQAGVKTSATSDSGGGRSIGSLANGDWTAYNTVQFGSVSPATVSLRVASGAISAATGSIDIRIDSKTGRKIGSIAMSNTGGWESWQTSKTAIDAVTGTHNVYLVMRSSAPWEFAQVNWLTFTAPVTSTPPTTAPVTPPSTTMPIGDLPGWKQVLAEDFTTAAPLGSFLSAYSNMGAYPYPWTDTSRNVRSNPGYYHPAKTLSASGGVMDAWLHYDSALGRHVVAAVTPKLPTMTYGRFSLRMRADKIPGYKIAPLLWPDSESWPSDGEIDFPEGDLDGTALSAFSHYANPNGGQDWFGTKVDPTQWHTYETLWSPGRIEFLVDGTSIGVSTTNVPSKAMHWVLQMETAITSTAPSTSAQGHVQIDWIKAYSRA